VERLARSHCSATATPSPAPAQDRA
jgi:hypothetical protein